MVVLLNMILKIIEAMTKTQITYKNKCTFLKNFFIRYNLHIFLLIPIVISFIPSTASAWNHPGGLHSDGQLRDTAGRIKSNAQPWKANWDQLLSFANSRLNETPSAVSNLYIPGYYQNSSGHISAKNVIQNDTMSAYSAAAVYALNAAMAGRIPSSDRYADQTIRILNAWARTNTGFSGPDGALVASYTAIGLVHAAELVYKYPGWRSADKAQFLRWAGTVLYAQANIKTRGLYTSTPYYSNWNDWGINLAVAIDNLTENYNNFLNDIKILKDLVTVQIESDGRMPSELKRGSSSILYTAFALESLTSAVTITRNAMGTDLRYWTPSGGGTVKQALDFLFNKGIENPSQWPVSSARYSSGNTAHTHELYAAMGRTFGVSKWTNWGKPPAPDLDTGIGWALPVLLQPTSY
jgi:Alginate lyase